jgi:hypothetical protein
VLELVRVMPDLRPPRRTRRPRHASDVSSRVLVALLVPGWACARFGYDLPDWGRDPPGAGGRQTISDDAGGPVPGNGAGGNGAGAGGLPDAGLDEGGSAGLGGAGSGGSLATSDAGTCFDGQRSAGEAGPDCGGPSCAPCRCVLGAPQRLGNPNYPGNDLWSPSPSSDGLSLYFAVTVPGVSEQIAISTRPDGSAAFGNGQPLPPPVNQGTEGTPNLTVSGLSLYFFSERPGGAGSRDLYVATRASTTGPFDDVRALSSLNTPDREHLPWASPDELSLYFISNRAGVADIYRATRGATDSDFGSPEPVTELNSDGEDGGVTLSPDGLEVILASNRPGGVGGRDLYVATRASATAPFSSPVSIPDLNTGNNEFDPGLSPDGSELYFASNRDGGDTVLYRSLRSCSP